MLCLFLFLVRALHFHPPNMLFSTAITGLALLSQLCIASSSGFPDQCPPVQNQTNGTLGTCPQSFTILGPHLEAVHESKNAPTGLAVDGTLAVYLTYPRNSGATPNNVVLATSFTDEEPWPSAAIQNCSAGQDPSTCFINVQNVVLDSRGVMWTVDSGIFPGNTTATPGGAKIQAFDVATRTLIRTYTIPEALLANGTNLNDVRINNTLGTGGFAFMTDESKNASLLAVDLHTGQAVKRLMNTSVVTADPGYVGSFDGQPIYSWNGTSKKATTTGADGIALQSGNFYWAVLASRRYYYIPQAVMANFSASDEEVLAAVVVPGQLGSETAGFTADDRGRVYLLASEQNAIYYVDTLQSEVTAEVNGTPAGGSGLVKPADYVVKTLVRSGLIQHADSAAILDGWLYFCTNQLELSPVFQYKNVDARRGPFRSYRVFIGRTAAV